MPSDITAVVPISPIKSHPEIGIVEETLDSIRHHLPNAEIILTFDGVRPEQEDRRKDYEEATRRLLWRADHHYGNVAPFVFDEHLHQTGMMRKVIDEIKTPMLLYMEQDTPLVTDEPIDFVAASRYVDTGWVDVVRFHHEAVIPEPHEYLMHGNVGNYLRTSQWSQRPHLASKAYYRRIIEDCFEPGEHVFIEDRMHGVVMQAQKLDGIAGWHQHRICIYRGLTGSPMKRSYHLDGRAGEQKYD